MKVQEFTFLLLSIVAFETISYAATEPVQEQSSVIEDASVTRQSVNAGNQKQIVAAKFEPQPSGAVEQKQGLLTNDELLKAYNDLKKVNEDLKKELYVVKDRMSKTYEMHNADHKCKKYRDQAACKQHEQLKKELTLLEKKAK
ncbi:MAG: hypothetical protein RL208_762 [Pseudomonadota bacterium]|jgi:hypothetical protein